MNIQSKINKLCIALKLKGYTFLINKEQFYSKKLNKVCTLNRLIRLMTIDEYNSIHPKAKKDTEKYEYVKEEIFRSCSNVEILKELVKLYREISDKNG